MRAVATPNLETSTMTNLDSPTGYVAMFTSNDESATHPFPVVLVDGKAVVIGPRGEMLDPASPAAEKALDAAFGGIVPAYAETESAAPPVLREKLKKARDAAGKVREERHPPVIDRGRPGPEPAPQPLPVVPPAHREPAPRSA